MRMILTFMVKILTYPFLVSSHTTTVQAVQQRCNLPVHFSAVVFSIIDNGRKKWNKPHWAPFGLFFEVVAIGYTILCALKLEVRVMAFCWQQEGVDPKVEGIPLIDWFMFVSFLVLGVLFTSLFVFFLVWRLCS